MKIAYLGPFLNIELKPYINTLTDEDCVLSPGMGYSVLNNIVDEFIIRKEFKISIITLDPNNTLSPLIRKSGNVELYSLPRRSKGLFRNLLINEKRYIIDAIDDSKPDLLHVHWTYEYAFSCLNVKIPKILTVHDHSFDVLKHLKLRYLPNFLLSLITINRFKYITAVSNYVANYINIIKLIQLDKVNVISNPIIIPLNLSQNRKGKQIVITSSTQWNSLKNPKFLLKSFGLFLKIFPDSQLNLAGLGMGVNEGAFYWANRKGLDINVNFLGQLDRTKYLEILSDSDIYIHTSKTEAMPLSILEAMLLGVPVLGGRKSGAIPELLLYGSCGKLININNFKDIFIKARQIIENTDETKEMVKKAKIRAFELTNPESIYMQYKNLYKYVLNRENKRNNNEVERSL
jgi:glycosyltransferase involved in cell wall biosynthesis